MSHHLAARFIGRLGFVAIAVLPGLAQAEEAAPPAGPAEAPAVAALPAEPPLPLGESLKGMARAEYAASRILYEDGDYQGSLLKLKSAYDYSKDARLLWNMAACEKNLRHYAEVVRLVDRYVSEGGALVTEQDRADAQALLDTVRAFVTDLTVEVDQAGATVLLDEQSLGTTPLPKAVQVDMGPHRIRVTKQGFVDFAIAQELPGGQPFRINAQLLAQRHEGRLRILASAGDVIQVDGHAVGSGLWEGVLPSGTHAVLLTAKGKRPHQTDVVVQDNDLATLHVTLQDDAKPVIIEKGGVPAWVWIASSAVLVGGGVGAYLLLRPDGETPYRTPTEGNWGAIEL